MKFHFFKMFILSFLVFSNTYHAKKPASKRTERFSRLVKHHVRMELGKNKKHEKSEIDYVLAKPWSHLITSLGAPIFGIGAALFGRSSVRQGAATVATEVLYPSLQNKAHPNYSKDFVSAQKFVNTIEIVGITALATYGAWWLLERNKIYKQFYDEGMTLRQREKEDSIIAHDLKTEQRKNWQRVPKLNDIQVDVRSKDANRKVGTAALAGATAAGFAGHVAASQSGNSSQALSFALAGAAIGGATSALWAYAKTTKKKTAQQIIDSENIEEFRTLKAQYPYIMSNHAAWIHENNLIKKLNMKALRHEKREITKIVTEIIAKDDLESIKQFSDYCCPKDTWKYKERALIIAGVHGSEKVARFLLNQRDDQPIKNFSYWAAQCGRVPKHLNVAV